MTGKKTFFSAILFVCALALYAKEKPYSPPPGGKEDKPLTFIIHTCINELDDFKKLVKQASRLKPYGRVQINIGVLADKAFHETPKGGSPWHEYANRNPTPYKFFPDPKIAPFIPAEFVRKNRQLLLEKARILRENDMDAAFFSYEPNFLPESFFEAYPEMLGPRVDHPRRSNAKAFAPCISIKETQEMYASMMAEMLKNAPEIKTFSFKTNDAGAGISWSDWLYSGPNGPSSTRNFSVGERVNQLMSSFRDGASRAKKELAVYMSEGSSNFSDVEKEDIQKRLPPNCYYRSTDSVEIKNISGFLSAVYPASGYFNPISFGNSVRGLKKGSGQRVFITLRAAYDRANEKLDVSDLMFEMIERSLRDGIPADEVSRLRQRQQLSEEWAGSRSAPLLLNALVMLDEAFAYKNSVMPGVSPMYWGLNNRYINRPLLIAPQALSAEEESYFLPYLFNVSREEGRMDYTDIHGARRSIPPGAMKNFVGRIRRACNMLEQIDASAPRKAYLNRMALSLRIYASIMRSCGNFAAAQQIRDRNANKLKGPMRRPGKDPVWNGDPDFIPFNEIMRDELDNTQELISALKNGGLSMIVLAKDAAHEDTFIAGPDLLNQLVKKRKIMLDHWLDIEGYLASPFK
ncbi:MAG TPA: hypothetical protein PK339_14805 [Flavitalea sp.]|nr:hypothetical protein [Flavitalea sp.]